jgi:hypothetical protein
MITTVFTCIKKSEHNKDSEKGTENSKERDVRDKSKKHNNGQERRRKTFHLSTRTKQNRSSRRTRFA